MKKLIALVLVLICMLSLVACSASNTDNTKPKTETIDNTVMEEPASLPSTNTAESLNDIIPMVMIEGKLYFDTGRESTVEARCGMMDGEITSSVDSWKEPTEDNQSNFGVGYGYQIGAEEGTIEIYINEKWWVFEAETTK